MQEFSFEALDRWEAAESAHQAATAARAQAEDDWVDAVVREQEANERASSTARPAPAQNSASEDERWQASLARFGLRLTVDAGGERGLATARAFGAGDELLRVAPTVAVLNEASRARRCHWSFAESERLLRCSACGYARYCSAAHQRDAWAQHKPECALLRASRPRVPGPTMLLLARLLRVVAGGAGDAAAADAADAWARGGAAALSLRAQLDGQPAARQQAMREQAALLCALVGRAEPQRPPPPPELAAELLARFAVNNHTLCDEELQEVGVGLYPLAALANHDCAPSAVQTFDGGTVVFRALRPLAAGEPVTIAYIELAQPVAARRAELRAQYLFECSCGRCAAEAAAPPAAAAAAAADADALVRGRAATLAAIDGARWAAALDASAACCEVAARLYPPASPALGLEWLRLAKLRAHCDELAGAVDAWERALRVLRVSHGEASALVRDATTAMNGAKAELAYGGAG